MEFTFDSRESTGEASIGTRRLDVSKGDEVYPDWWLGLVSQEIERGTKAGLFAPTRPPGENTLRSLIMII